MEAAYARAEEAHGIVDSKAEEDCPAVKVVIRVLKYDSDGNAVELLRLKI